MRKLVVLFFLTLFISRGFSTVIRVPADFPKIQLAIIASSNGDTVLVSPRTYFENIKFFGKKIIVASLFLTTGDYTIITNTIINGSNPVNPDTCSCVLFVNGEDTSSVIEGFTITGGTGTKWPDEHGAGVYVEGGGIFSALASPTIRNNIIINNEAIRKPSGVTSGGGGGMRCGDGAPRILNNVIINNRGMYGGGITLNYCGGAVVKNNIIVQNNVFLAAVGSSTYGGGGLWINEHLLTNSVTNIVENNTIIGNTAYGAGLAGYAGFGGGIYAGTTFLQFNNNIVWNNSQSKGHQVDITGTNTITSYNDLEESKTGTGNISINPLFADSSFYLSNTSPCIDAGNPSVLYNDPPRDLIPTLAQFPSLGGVMNDIGAYGGPGRSFLPNFLITFLFSPTTSVNFGNVLTASSKTTYIRLFNMGGIPLKIDSISFFANQNSELTKIIPLPLTIKPGYKDSLGINWTPVQQWIMSDTMYIFSNSLSSPVKITLSGNSKPTGINDNNYRPGSFKLEQNYPNPFNPSTKIEFSIPEKERVSLKVFNVLGELVSVLTDREYEKGNYQMEFNGSRFSTGVYLYELTAGNIREVKKLTLLK
jgi:hypothetical protein